MTFNLSRGLLCSLGLVLCAQSFASVTTPATTVMTEIFGDGQKVSYVILQYKQSIKASSISPLSFSVDGHKVIRAYANTSGERSNAGKNGSYVILELDTSIAADTKKPAGPLIQAGESSGRPPGGGGPKLGEKSNKPAMVEQLNVTVRQSSPVMRTDGEKAGQAGSIWTSSKTVDLMIGQFQQRVFIDPRFPDQPLKYNLYIPKDYSPTRHFPLVLFMHDAGAVSNAPTETLTQGLGAVIWSTPEEQSKHETFVLAPQYDRVIADDASGTTDQMDITVDLVKALSAQYNLDTNRLYNTGQSMGGMTSIAMDIKYPDVFAASLLVASQWNPEKVAPLAKKPLWIVVSEEDTKAKPGQDAITDKLKSLGSTVAKATWSAEDSADSLNQSVASMLARKATINYTVFKGGDHRYTWQHAYSIAGIRDWLLAQTKDSGQTAASLFELGDALSKDGDQFGAIQYFSRASEMGYARATEMLGAIYASGRGMGAPDYKAAAKYDDLAISQGSQRALTELGILYFQGTGIGQDFNKARMLWEKATAAGDMKAPRWLGLLYLNGHGVHQDASKASSLLNLAAGRGDITANYWLGFMYENGLGVTKDFKQAIALYEKAAPLDGRHVEGAACLALGRIYEKGLGVAPNPFVAEVWYQRGAVSGNTDSKEALDHIRKK
ncbi:alpha/beta hydrolase-fold protein [Aquitalea aquatica]|uniref:SEL1-like repeat protein n=1 Tax=Aquitalea aquatica TaxID=3044273 RepID=A0A838YEA5_9NEIS|nr:PHB depolymerase family esterase [Aquitalea magnusonii]MBA4709074.1 SEL1-like repeat protein [Aquitalea magnusonii]